MSLTNSKQERLNHICLEHDCPGKTLRRGSVVWGKLGKKYQFWPGMLLEHEDCGMEYPGPLHRWVYWFGDRRISKVENLNICDFDERFDTLYKKGGSQNYNDGIKAAKAVLEKRFNFNGTPSSEKKLRHSSYCVLDIPQDVVKDLSAIKLQKLISTNKMMIKKEEEPDINNVIGDEGVDETFSKGDSSSLDKESGISYPDSVSKCSESDLDQYLNKVSLKDGKYTLNNICVCCQVVCKGLQERYSHPIFVGLCCRECYIKLKECMFNLGQDDVHIYCSICATTGKTFICDNRKCCRVFCHECIEQYWNKQKITEIQHQSPWCCFLCTGDNTSDILKIKVNWEENVMNLFKTSRYPSIEYDLTEKCKLRVLSLHDGISTVLVALEELGIGVSRYIALEDDPKAVHISQVHHGTRPYYINLGSVENFNFDLAKEKCLPIHLLIGGFYNDLCSKKPRVNEDGEESDDNVRSLIQFCEFYRMRLLVNQNQGGHPFMWLFVNDADISAKRREMITRFLECDPIVLNTRKYTPHCHDRLAWGNIPGLASNWIQSGPLVAPILKDGGNLANPNKINRAWISKIENLFGFSQHYTDIGNVDILERQKLVGRSGNVYIFKKMLQPLRHLFALKENKSLCCKNIQTNFSLN